MTFKEIPNYFHYVWRQKFGLVVMVLLCVGAYLFRDPKVSTISDGFIAGTIALIIFQLATDFDRVETIADVLREHENTLLLGVTFHSSHTSPLTTREEAIKQHLKSGDCFRLLTATAQDFLLREEVLTALTSKLHEGIRVQLLLYTPVFDLRSFLDLSYLSDGEETEKAPLSIGEDVLSRLRIHHHHASDLIKIQKDQIFTRIRELRKDFDKSFEVKFFQVKHHISLSIYGDTHIYAAPLLLSTGGQELPCIELVPGKLDRKLFQKFEQDFMYLWTKKNILFSFDQMDEIYKYIDSNYSYFFQRRRIEDKDALEVEEFAHRIRGST